MASNTLFSDFLTQLGVPHTVAYSNAQFGAMPFQSMFGLSKLLDSYHIENEGLRLSDKDEIARLTPPYLADTPQGFVIVTKVNGSSVSYLTQGQSETMDLTEFKKAWNGVVLTAYPNKMSREPNYYAHRQREIIDQAKTWLLVAIVLCLFGYLFVSNGLYRHGSTIFVALIDIVGIYLTYMLVQKSLKIKNPTADKVCGVLEEGGCDSVLSLKVSSFFGIFKWSEVGFTYFSVSLLTLLVFPEWTGYLALINVLCLPYTVWSIWYQKFRAKIWCTLCVSVQTCLWLLFFGYLIGGWFKTIDGLHIEFFVLGATYIGVLLALNKILPYFDNKPKDQYNENDSEA